jgi:hypothetical protein
MLASYTEPNFDVRNPLEQDGLDCNDDVPGNGFWRDAGVDILSGLAWLLRKAPLDESDEL